MQISSRFTIATHMLIVLALEGKKRKLTSDILAGSVGVNPVIIRKTIILSVIGMAVGLLGGFFLHRFLIEKVAPSIISLNPQVSPSVYLFPLTAVTLILTLLGFFVNYRLRRVDMLEALKSVD